MSNLGTAPFVLEAANLHKAYPSGNRRIDVLRGISFGLSSGETVSIRGESGCGKSTFLNLLAGIEVPDQGETRWLNKSLVLVPESRRPALRARYLGFVFQAFYLIPELNTLENVLIAARIAGISLKEGRERAESLLDELGLADRLRSRPDQLSGGERQRTAIARALVNHPAVLLADEPTGNLDEHTSERVIEQLFQAVERRGAALVMVTHHPGYAARTARQYQLVDGVLR